MDLTDVFEKSQVNREDDGSDQKNFLHKFIHSCYAKLVICQDSPKWMTIIFHYDLVIL
jgi:hypothetical protein